MDRYEYSKVTLKELEVLRYLGLEYNFEPKVEVEVLSKICLECVKFWVALSVYKNELITLEQLCTCK